MSKGLATWTGYERQRRRWHPRMPKVERAHSTSFEKPTGGENCHQARAQEAESGPDKHAHGGQSCPQKCTAKPKSAKCLPNMRKRKSRIEPERAPRSTVRMVEAKRAKNGTVRKQTGGNAHEPVTERERSRLAHGAMGGSLRSISCRHHCFKSGNVEN
eukprot:6206908-Pleurochrysis_carterae.AAC.2